MITEETPGEEVGKPKNWQLRTKILMWSCIVLAVVALGTTVGWLNSYEPLAKEWAVIANVATAVGTIGLALFAVLAWRLQVKNIEKMEEQIHTAEDRTIEERQQAYLVNYMLALKKMADSATDSDIDTAELRQKTTDTWMVWSMDMIREHQEMREVTGRFNSMLGELAAEIEMDTCLVEARIRSSDKVSDRDGEESARIVTKFSREYLPSVRAYLGVIQDWQMNPSRRKEISGKLKEELSNVPRQSDEYV